jgi:glycerol-3-phosphate dehydrogenase (NAD(P)+)
MTAEPYSRIAILGGGAWGTALAIAAIAAGRTTLLWAREDEVVTTITRDHENKRFLPGVALPNELSATGDLKHAAQADALLVTAPAQVLGDFARMLAPLIAPGMPVVICAKGIEKNTGRLLHEIVAEALPDAACAILSGPSFAREVALGRPTAVTIAAEEGIAARLPPPPASPTAATPPTPAPPAPRAPKSSRRGQRSAWSSVHSRGVIVRRSPRFATISLFRIGPDVPSRASRRLR